MNGHSQKKKVWRLFSLALSFVMIAALAASLSPAQGRYGGEREKDKDKKKEDEKPQFPFQRFKGTINTVKLEERRFLLDTTEGFAVLVQIDDKTKIKHRKEKKGGPGVLFADLKKGDVVEVSGQLPPTRILQAEKIFVEAPEQK
ncbi:MAG: hypothetical protein LAO31_03355 [Acidobacteriia bacterium]|nr:hypothetical protein [Terriglobia bacterium]